MNYFPSIQHPMARLRPFLRHGENHHACSGRQFEVSNQKMLHPCAMTVLRGKRRASLATPPSHTKSAMAFPPPGVKSCTIAENIAAMAISPKGSAKTHATASEVNTTVSGKASMRDVMNAANETIPTTKSQITSVLPAKLPVLVNEESSCMEYLDLNGFLENPADGVGAWSSSE